MNSMDENAAQALAISALERLAGDDDLLMRFSAITGILPNDMRKSASQPGFLAGILDFFLSHEPDLVAWAEAENFNPELAMHARHTLAPEDMSGFE